MLNRNFLLLLQGKLVSGLGMSFYHVIVVLWVQANTGSASLIGAILMMQAVAMVICGPFGGVIADRVSRKWIIVLTDLAAGLMTLMVFAAMYFAPDATNLIITLLILDAIVSGIAASLFGPATSALLPQLIPVHSLQSANGLFQGSTQLVHMVGQATAGLLYRVIGGPLLVLATAVGFVLSAISEMFIQEPEREATEPGSKPASFWEDIVAGYQTLSGLPGFMPVLATFTAIQFFTMPLIVALPFYVETNLAAGPEWFGYLLSALAFGGVLGAISAHFLKTNRNNRARIFARLNLLSPLSFVALGLISEPAIALVAMASLTALASLVHVITFTTLQTLIPHALMGRATSIMATLMLITAPLAMGITGLLVDLLDKDVSILFLGSGGCIFLVVCTMILTGSHKRLFDYDLKDAGKQPDSAH